MQHIKAGNKVIDAQLLSGYESASGFRDAFSRIMGTVPTKLAKLILKAAWLDTKLGPMLVIADDDGLYLLEFVDRRGLEREVEALRKKLKAAIIPGKTMISQGIETEINNYFAGKLDNFTTPIHLIGSAFQQQVWQVLRQIPPGETRSYKAVANAINQPQACRTSGGI
jgi:AraC family transcriptional regulator of adaptative response/methylated-DNA-[protein]-cysteine methyltransferase